MKGYDFMQQRNKENELNKINLGEKIFNLKDEIINNFDKIIKIMYFIYLCIWLIFSVCLITYYYTSIINIVNSGMK